MKQNISILNVSNIDDYSLMTSDITHLNNDTISSYKFITDRFENIVCRPPEFINTNDELLFFGKSKNLFNYNYPFNPSFLVNFDYCTLIKDIYPVIAHDNYVLKDTYFNDEFFKSKSNFLKSSMNINNSSGSNPLEFFLHNKTSEINYLDEEVYLIPYNWHFNYHHWLIECLPRLKYYFELDLLKNTKIILPDNMSKFQKESIELFNFPEDKIIYCNDDYKFKKLYFSSLGNFSKKEIFWLRDYIFSKLNIKPEAKRNFYISRNDATQRRLGNEYQLTEFLKSRDYEIITLTGLSFTEQVKLFSQAKSIIAPHGAGLTNMIFTPENCHITELAPNDQVNHCFWLLANVLNLKYTFISGQKVSQNRDFIIDMNLIKHL